MHLRKDAMPFFLDYLVSCLWNFLGSVQLTLHQALARVRSSRTVNILPSHSTLVNNFSAHFLKVFSFTRAEIYSGVFVNFRIRLLASSQQYYLSLFIYVHMVYLYYTE